MLLKKLITVCRVRKGLGLTNEDYSTNPVFPNDTSYTAFFFEKDVNNLPAKLRKQYEEMKTAILQREVQFREMYGDDWRNVAVFQAYRMVRESAEKHDDSEDALIESFDSLDWVVDQKFAFGKKLLNIVKTELAETTTEPAAIEVRVGDEYKTWDPVNKEFVFSRKAEVAVAEEIERDFRGDPVKVTPMAKKAIARLKRATVQDRMTAQDIENDKDFEDFINYARKTGNLKEEEIEQLGEDVAIKKFSQFITEGKFLDTHLASGKPNPKHPSYAMHKKAYDEKQAEIKASTFSLKNQDARAKEKSLPVENPVKFHHIETAIGDAYPDGEPYDRLAQKFPSLHKMSGKDGSMLTDLANKVVRQNTKYKSFSEYADVLYKDFKADAEAYGRN